MRPETSAAQAARCVDPATGALTPPIHTSTTFERGVDGVLIAGAGHAWSGGDPAGSHTDAKGPDASALILAFCLRHKH